MALFNYSSNFSNISSKLSSVTGSSDWLKIFVSPDQTGGGHLITHGIDFGQSYQNGLRGLVPYNSAQDLAKTYLGGSGWTSFWSSTAQTAAASSGSVSEQTYLQNTLVSAYDIKQWIAQSFTANDAMRFKGTITVGESTITTVTSAGTINSFPTSCEIGDTYKITGTTNKILLDNVLVNSGDMLVCIQGGDGNNLNSSSYWTVVQSNVEYLTTYMINGSPHYIYTQNSSGSTFYIPTTSGYQGQVLMSTGSGAPTWAYQDSITAGKVQYALERGNGLSFGTNIDSYDGSAAVTISVVLASTTDIGGILLDNGTNSVAYNAASNTNHDPKPTISINNGGQIYLTPTNIYNALGYVPGNSTGTITGVVVASAADSITNTTSITANPYINIISGNGVSASYQITGNGAISVASVANSSALTISGNVFTTSVDGLVPMASTANKQTSNSDNIAMETTFLLGADAKWYKLPSTSFVGTWRNIKVNNTEILGSSVTGGKALNLVQGSHVTISALQTDGNYDGKVQVAAAWREIQTNQEVTVGNETHLALSPISDDPLAFDNSDTVLLVMEEEQLTGGGTRNVIKAHVVWYNIDRSINEII